MASERQSTASDTADERLSPGVEPGAGIERAVAGEVQVKRALLSVSDKSGLVEFARGLHELGVELVSTGGTAGALLQAGVPVRSIEDFTGFPEMMSGRVKTLHPRLYAGLLALRDDESHLQAAAEHEIEPVDLVCVNLYPFEAARARADATELEIIENIDIGGPTMIRAAAKNSAFAAVVVDPGDYESVLAELRASAASTSGAGRPGGDEAGAPGDESAGQPGGDELGASGARLSLETRTRLAGKAFALTARYDAAISNWYSQRVYGDEFPPSWRNAYEKISDLRYGENPHQRAAFYARAGAPTHLLGGVTQLHGKELSFNNLLDLSSARELVDEFERPACAIVKHNNPCGCALGETIEQAYTRAFACDPLSAYGGVIALNRPVDRACAERLAEQFIEVLLAPAYDPAALAILTAKKNVRLLELPDPAVQAGRPPARGTEIESKSVIGGQLVQTKDVVAETRADMRLMNEAAPEPSDEQWEDLLFAWKVCRHVRSNAIVIARDTATIGIGAGQTSRVDAVSLAVDKARATQPDLLPGSALASDAFFPFPDGPEVAIEAGVGAIVQPGGSVRDEQVVAAADAAGVAMVATGVRHFRH